MNRQPLRVRVAGARTPLGATVLRWLGALAVLLPLLLVGTGADAASAGRPPPPPPQRPVPTATAPVPVPVADHVSVEVMVVHGSDKYDGIDASLQPVMKHLRFLNYRGFKLLDRQEKSLGVGERATFEIAGDRSVRVELLAVSPDQARLRVQMFNRNGKMLDTTVSIHRNKSFMVAGPKHDDGVLVLPLTARY